MKKMLQFLDPLLVTGIIVSVFSAMVLVLLGKDEVSSMVIGLLITVITLLIDFIGRLKETEAKLLSANALGTVLIQNPELHKIVSEISNSYLLAQASGFDLFQLRSQDSLHECKDVLRGIANGYITVEAAGKYSYGKRGTENAQNEVKAVAYEDIESWRTEHLKGVIESNAVAIKRGIKIQRIFIVSSETMAKATDVLQAHKKAGVDVLTIPPDDLLSTEYLESYMIVDNKVVVVFSYTRDGKRFRGEKISIDSVEVGRYISKFNAMSRKARRFENEIG
jgi:hypothetical protein